MLLFRVALFFLVLTTPVLACSPSTEPEAIFSHIRRVLEGADSVGFAVVDNVDQKRSDADDSKSPSGQKLDESAVADRELRPQDQGIVDSAEVTAYLDIQLWLKTPNDDGISKLPSGNRVAIDLLFSRAAGSPCGGRTTNCPPDLASGEIVLVAIKAVPDRPTQEQEVVYCRRVTSDDLGRATATNEEWATAPLAIKVILFDEHLRQSLLKRNKIESLETLMDLYQREWKHPLGSFVPQPRPDKHY